ncbi:MAG: phospholipase [Anaerolineae bacterium]|nr:phospholipase [Gemmatimonadaceae bacterium]
MRLPAGVILIDPHTGAATVTHGAPPPLRQRRGSRPRTTPTNPHTQLDQQPEVEAAHPLRAALAKAVFALADVRERPSAVSVHGARALWLDADVARGPRDAFLVGTEFAHLHPAPDWSLHAALPPALAEEAVARGWAEVHPVARRGLLPANVVMIYAPRDESEVEVVRDLVFAAYGFARGEDTRASERSGESTALSEVAEP